MAYSRHLFLFLFFAGLILILPRASAREMNQGEVDHGPYGEILNTYLKNELVDYRGLKKDEAKLDRYLHMLNQAEPEFLSRPERFALYINAYNAYTLKLILKHYPVDSIKDIGGWFKSPWDIRFCKIGGKTYTLDEIEHEILRPRFEDPRIHAAVNCASIGCPPLRPEPFVGPRIDRQLDEAIRAFINDSKRNRLEGNTLYLSKIFKWYGEDFNGDKKDIVDYFLKYAEGDLKNGLLANKERMKIDYLDYDWSLNDASEAE